MGSPAPAERVFVEDPFLSMFDVSRVFLAAPAPQRQPPISSSQSGFVRLKILFLFMRSLMTLLDAMEERRGIGGGRGGASGSSGSLAISSTPRSASTALMAMAE